MSYPACPSIANNLLQTHQVNKKEILIVPVIDALIDFYDFISLFSP